jgi:hypothetical protein
MLASISFRYLKGKNGKFLKERFENLGGGVNEELKRKMNVFGVAH